MNSIPPNRTDSYQTLISLRLAGFSNERIYAALTCLFDTPMPRFVDPDYLEQPAPTSEPEHPFVAARRDGRIFLRRLSDNFEPLPMEEDQP